MSQANRLWRQDAEGYFFDMVVGQKFDAEIDLTDYWPSTETISTATWTVPTGVSVSNGGVSGLTAKKYFSADAAGEHACLATLSSASGLYVEPFRFRVIVR